MNHFKLVGLVKYFHLGWLLVLTNFAGFSFANGDDGKKVYLDYPTCQEIISFYQELKNPRPPSITENGYHLWSKGSKQVDDHSP